MSDDIAGVELRKRSASGPNLAVAMWLVDVELVLRDGTRRCVFTGEYHSEGLVVVEWLAEAIARFGGTTVTITRR